MAEAVVEGRPPPIRFFCYKCVKEFDHVLQDYMCPYCSGGFVEQVDAAQATAGGRSGSGRASSASRDHSSDIDMSSLGDPDDMDFGNDFALLMSGNQIRGVRGTVNMGGPETLMQQLLWQLTGGGAPGAQSASGGLLLLGGEPSDYVVSGEGLDAVMSQLLWHAEAEGPPPLPREAIADLPEVTVTADQVRMNAQCSVCLETFNIEEKVKQLSCAHLYHQACIAPWLSLHATCPICRQCLAPGEGDAPPHSQTTTQGLNAPSLAALLLRVYGGPSGAASSPPAPAQPTAAPSDTPRGARGPVGDVLSLFRSLTSPQSPQEGQNSRQPPHNYDMDLEFD